MKTYKQVWRDRVIWLLKVDISTARLLRGYLKKMTGHGLACLSEAIEKRLPIPKSTGQANLCGCEKPMVLEKSYCTECGRDMRPPAGD